VQKFDSEDKKNKKNTVALYILTVFLVVQFAVPTYGIIKDVLGQNEYVFVLGGSSVRAEIEQRKPSEVLGALLERLFPPSAAGGDKEPSLPGEGDANNPADPDGGKGEEKPGVKPGESTKPGGSGGSGGSVPPKPPGGFGVEDVDDIEYNTGGSVDINVFNHRKYSAGEDKFIAPGDFWNYDFKVRNDLDRPVNYKVSIEVTDGMPDGFKIPMRFQLKRKVGASFVTVVDWTDNPVTIVELSTAGALADIEYQLHWQWPEGPDDNRYLEHAGKAYTLTVKVGADV